MKDYEKVYRACEILDGYIEKGSDYNLNASHDTLHLCFDVRPEKLTTEHRNELKKLGVRFNESIDVWEMSCSC